MWEDESYTDAEGQQWVQIAYPSGKSPGRKERQEHIKAIDAGAPYLMVICEAVDKSAVPRTIRAFDHRTLLVGGELKREGGKTWIRVVDRKSVGEVR